MLIDWFTVIAQVINFLILIFLLHRFLYRPITKTIRSRQEEIDRHWQEARQQKQVATEEALSYEEKQRQLQQKEAEIMADAQEKAEQEYQKLIQQARQEVEEKQAAWSEAIAQQQEQFLENLQEKITEQVYKIARHALQELADTQLEQQALATFIYRLENLDEQERQALAQSLQNSDRGLVIRTSFELSRENREKLVASLHQQQIYSGNNVQFATAPSLICGIELQASNYKIAWNLQNYLQALDRHLANHFPQDIKELEKKKKSLEHRNEP